MTEERKLSLGEIEVGLGLLSKSDRDSWIDWENIPEEQREPLEIVEEIVPPAVALALSRQMGDYVAAAATADLYDPEQYGEMLKKDEMMVTNLALTEKLRGQDGLSQRVLAQAVVASLRELAESVRGAE